MSARDASLENQPLLRLQSCAGRLHDGPWRFIRLRGDQPVIDAIDQDDIDLLGSESSLASLLEAAFDWARNGDCHLRVKTGHGDKKTLFLISTDGRHRLTLDLWIRLWQVDRKKRCLRYDDCAPFVENPDDCIQRLPIVVEAAIFLHHLVTKRKKISDSKQIDRLACYAAALRQKHDDHLADALVRTRDDNHVSAETEKLSLAVIERTLALQSTTRLPRYFEKFKAAFSRLWFRPIADARMVTFMGCDGCGKTTLTGELKTRNPGIESVYTGKRLYRNSILYKMLVIGLRPLLFQGREKFDDTIAPVTYLLASMRLRLYSWRKRSGILLIDRSILDFLVIDRKTDTPRFSQFRALSAVFGTRLPHIHIILPHDKLKGRKLEITEAGHIIYDKMVFLAMTRREQSDYTVFDNSRELEESYASLERILEWIKRTI